MYDDEYNDDDGIVGPDQQDMDDYAEPVKYQDRVLECPNCHRQVYENNDSCPYCGDIMFRYLRHGTFAPKSKLAAKIFVVILALCLLYIIIGMAI